MRRYMGTRTWQCPDCGTRLQLPFVWGIRACRQPLELARLRALMVFDHAHRMPLLHPRLLPGHHATRSRA